MLQQHARKYSIPIDTLSFGFTVTSTLDAPDPVPSSRSPSPAPGSAPRLQRPEDGILVNGLWIDGARWDAEAGCLDQSEPGTMYAPLPVVHFTPLQNAEPSASGERYECPLYKTSTRAGVLSTTGASTNYVLSVSLPTRPGTAPDFWVLQGVALLCMLND